MKKILLILLSSLYTLFSFGEEIKLWTSVIIPDEYGAPVNYNIFTKGEQSFQDALLSEMEYSTKINSLFVYKVNDVSQLLDPKNENQKDEIRNVLKAAYNKVYFKKKGIQESKYREWISSEDIVLRTFTDENDLKRNLILPAAFAEEEGRIFNWFQAQIWSDWGPSSGMRKNDIRREVYKEIFLTIGSPVYGSEAQFRLLEEEYDRLFNNIFTKTAEMQWNIKDSYSDVQGFLGDFLSVYESDLIDHNVSAQYIGHVTNLKVKVKSKELPDAVAFAGLAKTGVEQMIKSLLLHLYSGAVGLDRLKSLGKLLNNTSKIEGYFYYDPMMKEGLTEAIAEYEDRMENYCDDAFWDLLNNRDLWLGAADIFLHADKVVGVLGKSLGTSSAAVLAPLWALQFSVDKYLFIEDQKDLFRQVTLYATLNKFFQSLADGNNLDHESNIMNQLYLYDAIRITGYSFYFNFSERMTSTWWSDLFSELNNWLKYGNEWSSISDYQDYLYNKSLPIVYNFRDHHGESWNYVKERDWLESLVTLPEESELLHDYSVEIIPTTNSIMVGDEVTITAQVTNEGTSNETQYATLILYDNGTEIDRTTTFAGLSAGATNTYTFDTWTATSGGHQFKVEVQLLGDENTDNDQDIYTVFVGSPGALLVDGETNPVKNITMSPDNSGEFTLQLQNTGSSALTVYPSPDTQSSNLFIGMSGGNIVEIAGKQTVEYNYVIGVQDKASPGDKLTRTLTFAYDDKEAVVTFNVEVVEFAPGEYEREMLAGSVTIDGAKSYSDDIYHKVDGKTIFNLDDDPTTSAPKGIEAKVNLDNSHLDRINFANWHIDKIEKLQWGKIKIKYPSATLYSSYDEIIDKTIPVEGLLGKLKKGDNICDIRISDDYGDSEEYWQVTNSRFRVEYSINAWGGDLPISSNDIDKWDNGNEYIRLYFHVDNIVELGDLHLYNNGENIANLTLQSYNEGHDIYFDISASELQSQNHFSINGDCNDDTKVTISNIRLKVKYYDGDPDINCSKSLSTSLISSARNITVNVNEYVNVNLKFENVGSNETDNLWYNDATSLPEGVEKVSGDDLEDRISGNIEPEEIEERSYVIKASKAGSYTFGATEVLYEDRSEDQYKTNFNAVTLNVVGGNIVVSVATEFSSYEKGNKVKILADITEDVNNSVLQDAKVICTVKNITTNTTLDEVVLVFDSNEDKFVGEFEGTSTSGTYQLEITAQHEGYTEGTSSAIQFEVVEEKYLEVTPASRNLAYNQTSTSFSVLSNVNWTVSEDVSWFSASKNGSEINVSIQQNTSQSIRSGIITVTSDDFPDKVVSVVQDGAPVPLVAGLFSDIQKGEAPLTANFYDQSNGNPTSWSWDFGDGNTSSQKNPEHIYTKSGTYTVKLSVAKTGDQASITKTDYIVVDPPVSSDPMVTISKTDIVNALCYGYIGTLNITYQVDGNENTVSEHGICITSESGSETCTTNGLGEGDFQFTSMLNPGIYSIRAYAKDESGNVSYSDPQNITISGPMAPLQIIDYTLVESMSSFTLFDLQVNGGTAPYMVQVTGSPDASSFGQWIALDDSAMYYNGLKAKTTYNIQLTIMDANGCTLVKDIQIKTDDVVTSPEIIITAPSGGEQWSVGSAQKITWSDNFEDDIVLLLYKGSLLSKTLVDSVSGYISSDGEYFWYIPEYITPDNDYFIKAVNLADQTVYDFSNRFEITEKVAPNVEVNLYHISDASGSKNSSNPGIVKDNFYPGETVRITLAATNTGGTIWPLGILNLMDESGTVIYDSHEQNSDISYPSAIDVQSDVAYMSFDWNIPTDAITGKFSVGAAIRDQNNWEIIYDETSPGANTTLFGSEWILENQFSIIEKTLESVEIIGLAEVDENSTSSYKCTATYSDGSTKDVTNTAKWSENSNYASISSGGVLTTSEVSSDKTVTITASYEGKSDSYGITIKNISVTPVSIEITGPASLNENSSAAYACTVKYDDGSTKDITGAVTWSENSSYASIDSNGILFTSDVDSNQPCTVTATYAEKTDVYSVTILNIRELVEIIIVGDSLIENEETAFKAIAQYSDNTQEDITDLVDWTVSCGNDVTINNGILNVNGKVTINCNIGISFLGMFASRTIQVVITDVDEMVEECDFIVYPNPFSKELNIEFNSQNVENLDIEIFDIMGQLVKKFNKRSVIGFNTLTWDATDQRENKVCSGLYVILIKAEKETNSYKVIYNESD